jgi:probable F420-dependent oxidoreductase
VNDVGRVGIWTRQLDTQPIARAQECAAELEALGYRTLWIPEAIEREVLSHATLLLSATDQLVIATGVARVQSRSAWATALTRRALDERFPGRFVLGLGVSHERIVERVLAQGYERPVDQMRSYLDALASFGVVASDVVIAALGPKMMALASERAGGAHTYMAPVEHTAWARSVLGATPLMPSVKVVLDPDADRAREWARGAVGPTLRMPAYRQNLLRLGYSEDDVAREPSDRVVDALVAGGDVDSVRRRVAAHLDAGADHVCIEVLTGDDTTVPMAAWRELAPALTTL